MKCPDCGARTVNYRGERQVCLSCGFGLNQILSAFTRDNPADAPTQQENHPDGWLSPLTTQFGLRLLAELLPRALGKNVVIAPAGLAAALGLYYHGAEGETRAGIGRALGLNGVDPEGYARANQHLRSSIARLNAGVSIVQADGLWARRGIFFKPEFENGSRDPTPLDLQTASFSDTATPERINAWLSEKTAGHLDRVVERFDPLAIMVGVNAACFSGRWQTPFQTEMTRTAPFNRPNSVSLPVPMMARNGRCLYQQRDGLQMAALPYGDGRISLVVILPGEKVSLEQAVAGLTAADWPAILAGFEETWGELRLPRFSISFETDLRTPLSRLGMASAFDADRANFGGMVPIPPMPYVYFDHLHHKVMLEVTEEGSLAEVVVPGIPATGEDAGHVTSLPPQPFNLTANRPFLAAIVDRHTGALLFLAAVVDP